MYRRFLYSVVAVLFIVGCGEKKEVVQRNDPPRPVLFRTETPASFNPGPDNLDILLDTVVTPDIVGSKEYEIMMWWDFRNWRKVKFCNVRIFIDGKVWRVQGALFRRVEPYMKYQYGMSMEWGKLYEFEIEPEGYKVIRKVTVDLRERK